MDFGCKGDNSTDDTGCFNKAMSKAATFGKGALGGARIFVPAPAAAYKIEGTISFPISAQGITLSGATASATQLNCSGSGDCISIPHIFDNGASAVVENLTLNGVNGASQSGIHAKDTTSLRLRDLIVQNFAGPDGTCLFFENSRFWTERITAEGVSTYNCGKHLRFFKDTADHNSSFGYNRFLDLKLNVLDGQVGFSIENGAYVYGGTYRMNMNVAQSKRPTYAISVSGGSTFQENECRVDGETDFGKPYVFDVSKGNIWRCTGDMQIDMKGGPGVTTGTISTELPSIVGNDRVETTFNLGAAGTAPGGIGTWIIPAFGPASGYYTGIGWNAYFNHYTSSATNSFLFQGDGVHNGGFLALLNPGDGQNGLDFFSVPSTGGKSRTISSAELSGNLRASINKNGLFANLIGAGFAANWIRGPGIGAYLIGPQGSANNFLFGYGNNVWWDGVSWRVIGDGAHNGGFAWLGSTNSAATLYVFGNTGASDQAVPSARLPSYAVATFSSTGATLDTHLLTNGNAPELSKCGVSPSISGTDTAGIIKPGSGASGSCTLKFAAAYANAPVCTANDLTSQNAVKPAATNAALTLTFTGVDQVAYICIGR